MKNRDNEFFREEELDELVEKRDYETLRDKMSRIFACPCCLNGFKHCRKYLEVFSKEEIRKTPTFAAAEAVIQAIYGNLEKAEKYASYVGTGRGQELHCLSWLKYIIIMAFCRIFLWQQAELP